MAIWSTFFTLSCAEGYGAINPICLDIGPVKSNCLCEDNRLKIIVPYNNQGLLGVTRHKT